MALLADALLEVQEQEDGDDEVPIIFNISIIMFLFTSWNQNILAIHLTG